ncbi:helix-turn-helix domain-containing protein, partial [Sphingobium abikonense]|uniref:helix-turn-helix domain-containing protein n=1 Tax=Sphingobium abikonense TaxID=86193 RepID=UPI003518D414
RARSLGQAPAATRAVMAQAHFLQGDFAGALAEGKLITAADLDLDQEAQGGADVINLKLAREMADRRAIRHAMARTDGNISGAARMLGISRPTLYDLLKHYHMQG